MKLKTTKALGLCLAISLPTLASGATTNQLLDEQDVYEACAEFSQAEMRDCLDQKAIDSQKTLQQAEETVMETLLQGDARYRHPIVSITRFVTSNQAFFRFHDAQCAFYVSLGGGAIGNALDMRRFVCTVILNHKQILWLRDAIPFAQWAVSDDPVRGERALLAECSELFSQAKIPTHECLAEKVQQSQKALHQAELDVMAMLAKWDEDNKFIIQSISKFIAANQEFVRHRKARCAFYASLWAWGEVTDGDSTLEEPRIACVTKSNQNRAVWLHDVVSNLPLK